MIDKDLIDAFVENIRRLPIEPITIATMTGPREISALLLGKWAIHENPEGWTVTHQRTGWAAGPAYPTPIEALIALGIYLGAGLRIPSDMTTETIRDTFRHIPGIADIGARIKSANALLDSWDLDLDYNEKEVDP